MARHSKIQLQILALYKDFLRVAKNKPGLKDYVRSEFKKNASIPRTSTMHIEQLYSRGQRKLNMFQKEGVESVGMFFEGREQK